MGSNTPLSAGTIVQLTYPIVGGATYCGTVTELSTDPVDSKYNQTAPNCDDPICNE